MPTLFLRLNTASQRLVERAVRGFQSCAPLVLNLLYTLDLTQSDCPVPKPLTMEAAIASAAQGKPALCAFGGREHAAVVLLEDEDTRYTVLLLLPTEAQARSWACSADAASRELAAALTALFADAAEEQA